MKKTASVCSLLFALCVFGAAAAMAQPATSVRDEALKLDAVRAKLTADLTELKTAGEAVAAQFREQTARAKQITAEARAGIQRNEELKTEMTEVNTARANLGASPCGTPNDDPKKCEAYNTELARLDKWQARIIADHDALVAKQGELKNRLAVVEAKGAETDKQRLAYESRKEMVLKQRYDYVIAVRSLCADERVAGDKALADRIGFCTAIVEMPAANKALDLMLGRPGFKCPEITIAGNTAPIEVGSEIFFTTAVTGGDPNIVPQYNWMISAAKIAKGQGTNEIFVDTTGMEPGSTVTATVEVKGYSENCFVTPSWTTDLKAARKRFVTQKADEFYGLTPAAEAARLDKVADILAQDENIILWITTYPGKTSQPGDTEKDFKRIEAYFLNSHRVKGWQIQPLTGGERKLPAIELWLADIKAQKPTPNPPKP